MDSLTRIASSDVPKTETQLLSTSDMQTAQTAKPCKSTLASRFVAEEITAIGFASLSTPRRSVRRVAQYAASLSTPRRSVRRVAQYAALSLIHI